MADLEMAWWLTSCCSHAGKAQTSPFQDLACKISKSDTTNHSAAPKIIACLACYLWNTPSKWQFLKQPGGFDNYFTVSLRHHGVLHIIFSCSRTVIIIFSRYVWYKYLRGSTCRVKVQ